MDLKNKLVFRLAALRFHFAAREPLRFQGPAANTLRGAFGIILRRLACLPQCHASATCEHRQSCPYARLFEPIASQPGPSGLFDQPRPFVFRTNDLDGRTFLTGEAFPVGLNLFDPDPQNIEYIQQTFAQIASEGLGPHRRKLELLSVSGIEPLTFDLTSGAKQVDRITVRFLSATELKDGHHLADKRNSTSSPRAPETASAPFGNSMAKAP